MFHLQMYILYLEKQISYIYLFWMTSYICTVNLCMFQMTMHTMISHFNSPILIILNDSKVRVS